MAIMRTFFLHPIPHLGAVGNVKFRGKSSGRCYPTNRGPAADASALRAPQFVSQRALHDIAKRRPGFERLPLGFEQKVFRNFNCRFHTASHITIFMADGDSSLSVDGKQSLTAATETFFAGPHPPQKLKGPESLSRNPGPLVFQS